MTSPTIERAARAVQDEIERQVAEPGYLGWGVGQEDHRPPITKTYVDGDLDVSALARAVLMAVREPDEKLVEAMNASAAFHVCLEHHAQTDARMWRAGVDAILNDGEGE